MRGIAAIAVVVFHLTQQFGHKPEPYAFLSVDFFFMLSGFVLSTAYERRLRAGMTLSEFMRLRTIRLYPMFALGSLFGAIALIGQNANHTGHSMGLAESIISVGLNILAIPSPVSPYLFPINPPGWSLFLEFVVNALFAWAFFRLSTRVLAGLLTIMAAVFTAAMLFHGDMDVGVAWPTVLYGIIRITFAFLLGVVFSRWSRGSSATPSPTALIVLLCFIVLLGLPIQGKPNPVFNLVAVLIMLPVLLWLGIRVQLPNWMLGFSAALGDLSYPLYAVHFPVMRITSFASRVSHVSPLIFSAAFLMAMIPASWMLARFVDAPVRSRWHQNENCRRKNLQVAPLSD